MATLKERLYSKTEEDPTTGCWNWTGAKTPGGYGRISDGKKKPPAHQVSWKVHYGPILSNHEIDHVCENPSCVNPDHLQAVTREQHRANERARKTHCKQGHEMDDINTGIRGDGRLYCRACNRIAARKSQAKRVTQSVTYPHDVHRIEEPNENNGLLEKTVKTKLYEWPGGGNGRRRRLKK